MHKLKAVHILGILDPNTSPLRTQGVNLDGCFILMMSHMTNGRKNRKGERGGASMCQTNIRFYVFSSVGFMYGERRERDG